jgi:hypothetical protein
MNGTLHTWLLGSICLLAVAAGGVLLTDPWWTNRDAVRGESFQRLVGGLGLGPATCLSPDVTAFDPRVGAACEADLAPIPGGGWLSGTDACSILPYRRSFVAGNPIQTTGDADAKAD